MPQDCATGDFEQRDTPQHFLFDINDVLSYSADVLYFYYYRLCDNNQEIFYKNVIESLYLENHEDFMAWMGLGETPRLPIVGNGGVCQRISAMTS